MFTNLNSPFKVVVEGNHICPKCETSFHTNGWSYNDKTYCGLMCSYSQYYSDNSNQNEKTDKQMIRGLTVVVGSIMISAIIGLAMILWIVVSIIWPF